MKIRMGFVSNSSSSSFICCISGSEESGMDMSLSDAGMVECESGHTFLEEFIIDQEGFEALKDMIENSEDEDVDIPEHLKEYIIEDVIYGIGIPSIFCPICTLKHILDRSLLNYIKEKYNINEDEIKNEIQKNFKTLDELEEYKK